ncbi:MAG: hypothetical protein IKY26_05145 [Erysipelotrichaceae bacterium]|nr:hypothetical protein [Erysipelotrichaceae bacterium]
MEKELFERLLVEFNENNVRANDLRDFIIKNEEFAELDNLNKDLLIAQLKAMEAYLSVLSIRIGLNAPQNVDLSEMTGESDAEVVSE